MQMRTALNRSVFASLVMLVAALGSVTAGAKSSSQNLSGNNSVTSSQVPRGASASEDVAQDADVAQPSELLKALNSGWPKQIESMGLSPRKSYVVLLLRPPPSPMDLRSPEFFRQSMHKSGFGADIGHAMVGWQCQKANGDVVKGFAGMTGESSNQSRSMVMRGWGATVFLSAFRDGYLQDPKELEEDIQDDIEDGHTLRFAAVEIPNGDCGKMTKFVDQFVTHPNRPFEIFGLREDPNKFEGGGCVSFATAVANKSGVWPEISANFWRELPVKRSLMGFRFKTPDETIQPYWPWSKKKQVSVAVDDFMNSSWDAKNGEESVRLHVIDPEMMVMTVRVLRKVALGNENIKGFPKEEKRIARYYVPDPPRVGESVSKSYSNWKQEVTEDFDAQTSRLVTATKNWARAKKKQGFTIREARAPGLLGVKIERR